ncbi:YdeI/OmpD-associated family protein [Quadrisphaera oryzae]|uniref:YdeI/OmpD-associated family protein n=1 Tax=Quadrisphaera TaxID=317661 RepID=UPI0016452B29|nr:YdeI/OmpD-associated family protein [Quadrisphaera sp. RL12-1S]
MATPLPDLVVADAAAWGAWLEEHATASAGVRLALAKGGATEPTALLYEQAVLEALCHGWIDGQVTARDDVSYAIRMTPRRPRSNWSAVNVQRVAALEAAGRMRPRGAAEVAAAKADGRWERAYAGSATIQPPPELAEALAADPVAAAAWEAMSRGDRYPWLYRMHTVKRPETRARHVAALLEQLRSARP